MKRTVAIIAVCAMASLSSLALSEKSASPYDRFLALTGRDARSIQVRIVSLGSRVSAAPALGFCHADSTMNWSRFGPYQRPLTADSYDADSMFAVRIVRLSSEDLSDLVTRLGSIPEVADGGEDTPMDWALSLTALDRGNPIGFESVITNSVAVKAFEAMFAASPESAYCDISRLPGTYGQIPRGIAPLNVTPETVSEIGRMRLLPGGPLACDVRITNVSGRTLPGPIIAVVNLDGELLNEDGRTCVASPSSGLSYRIVSRDSLRDGATVKAELHIRTDDPEEVRLNMVGVFAGPGHM